MSHRADLTLRAMIPEDWPAVRDIYAQGIATGQATFETDPPDWAGFDARHAPAPRIVASTRSEIVGWAALSPVSTRAVYRGVGEVSLYVHDAHRRQGVGRLLLQELIERSEQAGYWTLQAAIFVENRVSLHLHAVCGFRLVGRRERIARLDGPWRETLLLERRSAIVGR